MMQVQDLTVQYGKSLAVKGISFDAKEGNILSLIGPNGSGKSSVLKSIVGLVKPSHGSIKFARREEGQIGFKIGYMPQAPLFPKNVKVSELVDFLKKLESSDPEEFNELFELLGLKNYENIKFGALSGGTKQKVNILQCFSVRKPVYIVDEPTASLDPYISNLLKEILLRKKKEGALLVFSTHILSEVEEIADRFLLMSEGSLLIDDSPGNFVKNKSGGNLQNTLMEFWNTKYSERR
ncbi:ABC transporter ATP-binding protein [Leptospira haakeii]|uniref:ABC transporter ATP-binding protein n=1 Tax=Leptospira haakeii TaxID=2023198 RepID=A0ABX4PJ74_9LEPT|nr:ABC transporter ATP-binding protein [Leptospira haakeii]PKA15849.1 ABC transporter ATP-binding protein [Leptospira haakeii]PKA19369.1 ABC transporter ATP-binding protein [Leptospira haakeii]